ncbi:MAG: tetratricopeptide repeat protein [Pseudohongiellaceae bacterium]
MNAAEEETLEALKTWWEENGRRLVITAVVLVGGYTGWLLWQNSQTATAEAASDSYEQILNLALPAADASVTEQDGRQIIALSEQLRSDYPNSDYARFGALFGAQQHVELDDLQAAETALRWILDNPKTGLLSDEDIGLHLTATLRLGRVLLAQGETEAALQLVNSVDPQSFEAGFAELRGDIYLAMGRIVDARDAYTAARQAGSASSNLQMKLNSLADDS